MARKERGARRTMEGAIHDGLTTLWVGVNTSYTVYTFCSQGGIIAPVKMPPCVTEGSFRMPCMLIAQQYPSSASNTRSVVMRYLALPSPFRPCHSDAGRAIKSVPILSHLGVTCKVRSPARNFRNALHAITTLERGLAAGRAYTGASLLQLAYRQER